MTPRERTVVSAIATALISNVTVDMDALATSYAVPDNYVLSTPKRRAAYLLRALVESSERG